MAKLQPNLELQWSQRKTSSTWVLSMRDDLRVNAEFVTCTYCGIPQIR